MNASQLWETTMDPENRTLKQITIEDASMASKLITDLMGKEVTPRKDFIAKNEFKDDAVFEIIEKILKKTSARQLATQLEKLLDISINIPRDYERRSICA